MMKTKTISTLAIVFAVAALSALSPLLINGAYAAITTKCSNGGGNTPQGNCNGEGLTTTNVNPAGSAPPGQNK